VAVSELFLVAKDTTGPQTRLAYSAHSDSSSDANRH